MKPRSILLAIPLASLLVLTPSVAAASSVNAPGEDRPDISLDVLSTASTVEAERALFRELVAAQDAAEPVGTLDEFAEPETPTSWWAEFSRFLATADLEGSLEAFDNEDEP